MLRGCAQLLRSAAAQQLLAGTQNASALTSLGAALACGVRQLGLQQSLLPALQPGGSRSFASQGDGGSSEGGHAAGGCTNAVQAVVQQVLAEPQLAGRPDWPAGCARLPPPTARCPARPPQPRARSSRGRPPRAWPPQQSAPRRRSGARGATL